MLKHQETINNLTIEQKLNLIADMSYLSGIVNGENFKYLKQMPLDDDKNFGSYPNYRSLARSWDTQLIGQVADEVFTEAKSNDVTLVNLPDLRVRVSPYDEGLSEDPCLSGATAGAFVDAGVRNGLDVSGYDPFISNEFDVYSDVEVNPRAVNDYYMLPFNSVISHGVNIFKTSATPIKSKYNEFNEKTLERIQNRFDVIFETVPDEEFIKKVFHEGKYVSKGSIQVVTDAYERYLQLMKSFEEGELALADVNMACENGTAISPDMVDNVVDRLLCFAEERCGKPVTAKSVNLLDRTKLATRSHVESTVMLKNDKTLPISKKTKVAVVGALAYRQLKGNDSLLDITATYFKGKNTSLIGYEQGYGAVKHNNAELVNRAKILSNRADVIILALGYDEKDEIKSKKDKNCKLPANQIILLNELYKTGKKIIAVLYGDCSFDMSFDGKCNSVLLATGFGEEASMALASIIYGKSCPGGKLTNTLYEDTDERFLDLKNYKNAKRNEVGIFYGYRHYDTAGYKVKYPFGYGLSYTSFKFSKLKVSKGVISVTVKNVGKVAGTETVQLYVGAKKSTVIRPTKELKAFTKVRLNAGRSIRVSFKIKDLDLNVYDATKNTKVAEFGEYLVYVGTSVSDIKLKSLFISGKGKVTEDKKLKSDYFQNVSNIKDGKYYLEEPITLPKYAKDSKIRKAFAWLMIILFLDLVYLSLYDIKYLPGDIVTFIVLGVITAIPLISLNALKNAKKKALNKFLEKSKIMKQEKRNSLSLDELYEEIPYEQLFVEEFDEPFIEAKDTEVVETVEVYEEQAVYEFDSSFTISKACEELTLYMKERGIYVDVNSVRSIFSLLASSRLLFLSSENKELLSRFIRLLGKYFNCGNVISDFDSLHLAGDDVIGGTFVDGELKYNAITNSIINDAQAENKVRLMVIENALTEFIKPCLVQVFKHIDKPDGEITVSIREDSNESFYKMPENVWFIVTLADEERITDVPKYILESAGSLDIVLREIESVKKPNRVAEYLNEKLEEKIEDVEIEEDVVGAEFSVNVDEEIVEEEAEEIVSEEVAVEEVTEEIETTTTVKEISYYQLTKMIEIACRNNQLDETLWKRLDKLEEAVQKVDATFRISNKLWQRVEKFVAIYLTAGGEQEETLDSVVANHVINTMIISLLKGKNNEKFAHTVENIFGEGHVPHTVKAIKSTGLKI